MAAVGGGWRSIERKLPLLISGLLLGTVALFTLAAYHRIQRVLLATAGQRLASASMPVAFLLTQSTGQYRTRLAHVAADPALTEYLRTGARPDAVRRALAAAWQGETNPRGRIELRRADGTVALDTTLGGAPPGSGWIDRTIAARRVATDAPSIGTIHTSGNATYSEAVAAVPAPRVRDGTGTGSSLAAPAGYIADFRFLSTQGAQTVRDLIGAQATLLLGSVGDGDWFDLEHPAPPPPRGVRPGHPLVFATSARGAGVGAATPISGAPWLLWVEQPQAIVLAPMHALLTQMAVLAALILLLGTGGAWLVSRRITRPILALTAAAEQISATDAPASTSAQGPDEIARLSEAFARMSARVIESRQTLEDRVSERTQRLKEALSELELAQHQLVQKERLAMLGQLSSAVGHELRNPLGVMTNALYVIDQSIPDAPPMVREYLDLLRGQIAISERIVGDLLDTARVRPPQVAPVVLPDFVATQLRRLGSLEGIDVRLQFDPDLPCAAVDPAQLGQILLNLFSNALQAIGEGGPGTLTVSGVQRPDGRLDLTVADSGPGIAPDVIHRVFEPLFTTKARGLGLGLWVSRTLAHANGGDLTVTSNPGDGARFFLTMPAAARSAEAA